jgi:hypothetical protein
MSTRYFMCMNIAGFMRNNRFPSGYEGMFNDNGRTLTPYEAHEHLLGEVAKGRKVIPCSGECGNPCKHADKGCTGFEYQGGGCPGYNIPEPSDADPGDEHVVRRAA